MLCGEVNIAEICFSSVESECPREIFGCDRLHSRDYFHWQVKDPSQGNWINLPINQVNALERNYCDPATVNFDLPPLNASTLRNSLKPLLSTMKGNTRWKVDFDQMQLKLNTDGILWYSNGIQMEHLILRRLASENIQHKKLPATTYSWYFLDVNGSWIEYGQRDSSGRHSACAVSSSIIEQNYQQNPNQMITFSSPQFTYIIDFGRMVQTNTSTGTERAVRRRPAPHMKRQWTKNTNNFPPTWKFMKDETKLLRVRLHSLSDEYKTVEGLVRRRGGHDINIAKIERVQNKFLYFSYKNKMEELKMIYKNENNLNIQQLFHGTGPDIVEDICDQNFDWRLHGSNVGQIHGRGTYFAMSPSYSYNYAKRDNCGQRYIFIARVIVGNLVVGDSSMVRPPKNPATNALYDSSCDNVSSPKIIVKYDSQEYYPEYIIVAN